LRRPESDGEHGQQMVGTEERMRDAGHPSVALVHYVRPRAIRGQHPRNSDASKQS
jgi:hypothetical protein